MEKTLVWQAIEALNSLERKHLGQWIRSEYHNRKPEMVQLYQCILDGIKQAKSLPKEGIMAAIYEKNDHLSPKKDYDSAIRLLLSELLSQVELFLAHRYYFDNSAHVDLGAASAYRQKGLDRHFQQSLSAAEKKWEQQPHRHSGYFEAKATIAYEKYQFLSVGRRTTPLNLQEVLDNTDLAYMAVKLRQACFALTHQTVYNVDYDLGLLYPTLAYIESRRELLAIPAIGLYYFCYQFLKDQTSEEVFQTFKSQLITYRPNFPDDEMRNLHLLALNYCIKRINQTDKPFIKEALDIYKSGLEGDLLLENGHLSPFAFNNIVALALRNGEKDWTVQFIEQYHNKLEPRHREANYRLNLARVAYAGQLYNDALMHLQQADYKDLHNNMIARILQMKIFYETDEWETLDAHLQSMQTFIRRQRIFGYHKTNYLNIVKYTKKLINHRPNDRTEQQKLIEKIKNEPFFTEREWFLEQLQ